MADAAKPADKPVKKLNPLVEALRVALPGLQIATQPIGAAAAYETLRGVMVREDQPAPGPFPDPVCFKSAAEAQARWIDLIRPLAENGGKLFWNVEPSLISDHAGDKFIHSRFALAEK
jgi:hypothetical protein